ncbi:hypothetical protein BU23DRAFT_267249 [Bimuria novae-zelandiae CBS 107.79]|uniref:Uncharacterized protein n=1 Tax=Bimuria novae-zelandiae CBS 107.79 TaxID=1447943 RepID=A0A6A5UV14_9PLEO|nr:hypothetical protein BU23DRAFT_267249 [Bimuria novae-zelandiae CBS 107.79]
MLILSCPFGSQQMRWRQPWCCWGILSVVTRHAACRGSLRTEVRVTDTMSKGEAALGVGFHVQEKALRSGFGQLETGCVPVQRRLICLFLDGVTACAGSMRAEPQCALNTKTS